MSDIIRSLPKRNDSGSVICAGMQIVGPEEGYRVGKNTVTMCALATLGSSHNDALFCSSSPDLRHLHPPIEPVRAEQVPLSFHTKCVVNLVPQGFFWKEDVEKESRGVLYIKH